MRLLVWFANFQRRGGAALLPETIQVNGVECPVIYRSPTWASSYSTATVHIPVAQLHRVGELPKFPDTVFLVGVQVEGNDGTVLVNAYSLASAKREIARLNRQQTALANRQQFLLEVAELWRMSDKLATQGWPVNELRRRISRAEMTASRLGAYYVRDTSVEAVTQAIRQAELEIERLSGDFMEVVIDELLMGRFAHPDVAFNQDILRQLNALQIRSDGFIESLTDEQVRLHYRACLDGIRYVSDVYRYGLRLRLEDYAPADVLAELDLLPDTIELQGRKRLVSCQVSYGYEQLDGERMAVATITLPLAVYERNCVEHGRKSNFPEMPEGVRLIIVVTENDEIVARGEDGASLQAQIRKFRKAKRRGANISNTDEFGFRRRAPLQAAAPPPWHVRSR